MSSITNNGEAYKLSNSELQTFKDCRRKWWLAYYRRLKPKEKKYVGPLALGSRVHEALDQYYTNGTPLLDVHASLVDVDRHAMAVMGRNPDELDSEADLGRIMLEGYLEWNAEEGIDSGYDLISAEEILSMPMFDGQVELQGKLDQRVRRKSDGVRLFRDFKTVGGSFTQFEATAHMNEQILTYMMLEASQNTEEDSRSEGGIFTLIKKVKRSAKANPPFYEQFTIRHNIFMIRSFWNRIHATVEDLMGVKKSLDDGVHHSKTAYPRPSNDCTWKCQFFSVCYMLDDGSAAEDAIRDQFVEGDPYDYYAANEKKGTE